MLCISTQNGLAAEVPDLTPLLPYLSEQTYFSISNYSDSGWKEGENVEKSLRSLFAYFDNLFGNLRHHYRGYLAQRSCYTISIGYRNAMRHIRNYYNKRYLYVNNMEYEIGYLCHRIISKYQIMVELYHIVKKKFVMQQDQRFASPNLLFYLYTNILVQEKDITHLCNMLHEIEKKYIGKKPGWFDDYEEKTKRPNVTGKVHKERPDFESSVKNYLSFYEREKKRRRKERKKQRIAALESGRYFVTTPKRRPKKSRWPLQYGWSIENW